MRSGLLAALLGQGGAAPPSGYDVVIVDYGQLMEVTGAKSEYDANTTAARGLQSLAKRAPCTVIALSQVSQEHQRLGSADTVFGFKGSGAWAEVADLGLMLTRDKTTPDVLELAAAKNRHGLNAASGAKARLKMDRLSGSLSEIVDLPSIAAYPKGEPVAPWIDREDEEDVPF